MNPSHIVRGSRVTTANELLATSASEKLDRLVWVQTVSKREVAYAERLARLKYRGFFRAAA
jgi:hypothetical protein